MPKDYNLLCRSFDATFDDVYQDVRYARVMGAKRPIDARNLKLGFGLALFFGDHLLLPARVALDHGLLRQFARTKDWDALVFRYLVSPIAMEQTWDEVIEACGGGPNSEARPVWMSSLPDEVNREIRKAWGKGRGWRKSRELWRRECCGALEIVDAFKRHSTAPRPYPKGVDPFANTYGRHLKRRIAMLRPPPEIAHALEGVATRGDALERLHALPPEVGPWKLASAMQAAIAAKHDEWRTQLGVGTGAVPVGRVEVRSVRSSGWRLEELPALGKALTTAASGAELAALAADERFGVLRTALAQARTAPGGKPTRELKRLCAYGAQRLGLRRGEFVAQLAMTVGGGFTVRQLGGALAEVTEGRPGAHVIALLHSGALLTLGAAAKAGIWPRAYFNLSVYRELIRVGRGRC